MRASLDVGDSATATVVWPDTGADAVTVDLPQVSFAGGRVQGGAAWRISDVPIKD